MATVPKTPTLHFSGVFTQSLQNVCLRQPCLSCGMHTITSFTILRRVHVAGCVHSGHVVNETGDLEPVGYS